jgi:hypothetical protein
LSGQAFRLNLLLALGLQVQVAEALQGEPFRVNPKMTNRGLFSYLVALTAIGTNEYER